jgi:hypothetical protein
MKVLDAKRALIKIPPQLNMQDTRVCLVACVTGDFMMCLLACTEKQVRSYSVEISHLMQAVLRFYDVFVSLYELGEASTHTLFVSLYELRLAKK